MEYDDRYHPTESNDYDNKPNDRAIDDLKKFDKGYNKIYKDLIRTDGSKKRTKIEVYTSSGYGTRIRDAETGMYYKNTVGSADEDLFFKTVLATGECKSANGSHILFYLSPAHYAKHLHIKLSDSTIKSWTEKTNSYSKKV